MSSPVTQDLCVSEHNRLEDYVWTQVKQKVRVSYTEICFVMIRQGKIYVLCLYKNRQNWEVLWFLGGRDEGDEDPNGNQDGKKTTQRQTKTKLGIDIPLEMIEIVPQAFNIKVYDRDNNLVISSKTTLAIVEPDKTLLEQIKKQYPAVGRYNGWHWVDVDKITREMLKQNDQRDFGPGLIELLQCVSLHLEKRGIKSDLRGYLQSDIAPDNQCLSEINELLKRLLEIDDEQQAIVQRTIVIHREQ